jgi:molybdopterin-guanine dinucleotide biosynthesis protein
MSRPFYSTVTRISDVETRAHDVTKLPRSDWETGDYVLCEVHGRPGPLFQIERPSGRMCQVFDGDLVVGAFGVRAATLEGVGGWQDIGEDGRLHALTSAGLFGKATSVSPLLPPLMELEYRGHLTRGSKLTMKSFCPPVDSVPLAIPVVLLIGTSMSSGKTASGRVIVHELSQLGFKVAAAKLTGAARFRDMLSWKDAGASHVFDFVDVGLPSTVCPPEDFTDPLEQLLSKIATAGADILVAEAGASPLEPYNGSIAMQKIDSKVKMLVLSASDPYAVMGVQHAFSRKPDLVCGPATNTEAAIELVGKLCGVPALNLLRRKSRPVLVEMLKERLAFQ